LYYILLLKKKSYGELYPARNYRPQTFNSLGGTKAIITNTLLNAIEAITLPLP
jgi:DNA polymerase III gamma/tau subunit